ncbi:MAG TPA: sterol desaturase family protein [Thermoanaerobaculia bacterium]|nr:sterol desaturase family protein [Thermoanaerobaculia bacterium]
MSVRILVLVASCAVLWSLESVVPLYRYRKDRLRRALPNVALTVLVLLMNLALSFATATVATSAKATWLKVVIGIVALDFFAYLAHVTLHKLPLGWRFHRVHHCEEEVDVTTAFRQHPGETVWRVLWQLPAIVIFGVPLWAVVVYLTISSLNAQLEHANVRVPERLDRMLRLLFVTPNMHKVHHSRQQTETDTNYANIFSVWDRLFGTYTRRVDFETLRYGLGDVDDHAARSFRGLMAMPFRAK